MNKDNGFWQYATSFYSRPGVMALCLTLQNEHQCSVNRLLFALWLASKGRVLLTEFDDPAALSWRESLLDPLRTLRYRIREQKEARPELETCYLALKQAELEAEKIEIKRLDACLEKCPVANEDDSLAYNNVCCAAGVAPSDAGEIDELLRSLVEKHQLSGSI